MRTLTDREANRVRTARISCSPRIASAKRAFAHAARHALGVRSIAGMYALLIAANALAWMWAIAAFAGRPALLGTALLAYIFGLRHAVDADHIAAIDNVVRKLMQEGQRPHAAGLFFALGHSTVVALATVAVAVTATAFAARFEWLRAAGGVVGTGVSAFFLIAIGLMNLGILRGLWEGFKHARAGGALAPSHLDPALAGTGLLSRVLAPLSRMVARSRHMYLLGLLFGLGFDTATEVGLLGIAAHEASHGLSPLSILIFPALFAAGMALVDTSDGVLMVGAYGWAFLHPSRRLWYNLTITAASLLMALLIGGVEALGLVAAKLGLAGAFWSAVAALNADLASFGFLVIGLFALSWIVSALIYRFGGFGAPVPEAVAERAHELRQSRLGAP